MLTQRTLEILVRNRLTLAILLGSPALVVAMFAVLFRPGAFDVDDPSPSSMVMVGFWVVFAAFFFGLTYGLLQIVTERSILRRERLVGLRPGAYLASKVTILGPFLLLVVAAMLAVLRLFDRLPDRPLATYASIGTGLLLCAIAALGLGLLTSAIVSTAAQATLALPMLCFPAVLFSGAILPVHLMASGGRRAQRGDPVALGVRGHRPRPRRPPDPRRRRLATRTAAARLLRRRRHAAHRHLLARAHPVRRRLPRRHLGRPRAHQRRALSAHAPARRSRSQARPPTTTISASYSAVKAAHMTELDRIGPGQLFTERNQPC